MEWNTLKIASQETIKKYGLAMTLEEDFYPESRFGGFTDIDGTIAFYLRVNALLKSSDVLLEVGCGRAAFKEDPVAIRREMRIFKGKVKRVIGIDTDTDAQQNPYLDEFKLLEGNNWPIESNSINCIVCDYVLEHLPDPEAFFAETQRVLVNGGYLCIRTTNAWSYVALAARMVPNKHHSKVLNVVQASRKVQDVFPVEYKCNNVWRVRSALSRHGFEGSAYCYEAEPSYLSFSRLAYFIGVLHQRFSPRLFKPAIFAFGRLQKR